MADRLTVLIVGAGPTGLSIAIELQRFNIPFRIIDKKNHPVTTSNALVIQPRTLEMWDDIGLIDKFLAHGKKLRGLEIYADRKFLGGLYTKQLDSLHPYLLGLAQADTESLLRECITQPIEFDTELTKLHEDEGGYEVTLQTGDRQEQLQVTWLLAADGGHSTVRKLMNIPFEGRDLTQHFVMGDVRLKSSFDEHTVVIFFSLLGTAAYIPFDKQYSRILFEVSADPTLRTEFKPTGAQLESLLLARSKFDFDIEETIWTSGFAIHEKIIPNFRSNRIFFVGDAAHVHSPAGGQGMNTGIQDAYNLCWKLACVIRGQAPESLLNSYSAERRPVAKKILGLATLLTRSATLHSKFIFKIRNLIMPLLLKTKLGSKFLATNSQLNIHYRKSPLSLECNKNQPGPRAGDRFLDVLLDETRQESLLSNIRGEACILFFSGILREGRLARILEIKEELFSKYSELFKVVIISVVPIEAVVTNAVVINDLEQKIHRSYQVTMPSLYYIRPDKYLGFRGRLGDYDKLLSYLKKIYFNG